jgi:hypothetical protein
LLGTSGWCWTCRASCPSLSSAGVTGVNDHTLYERHEWKTVNQVATSLMNEGGTQMTGQSQKQGEEKPIRASDRCVKGEMICTRQQRSTSLEANGEGFLWKQCSHQYYYNSQWAEE